jgi:hypothetical protein
MLSAQSTKNMSEHSVFPVIEQRFAEEQSLRVDNFPMEITNHDA